MMLSFLLECAARSFGLAVLVGVGLRLFRIRDSRDRLFAWTAVLFSALTMPLLMKMMEAVLAAAPSSSWMPVSPPSLLLRPLSAAPAGPPSASLGLLDAASAAYALVALLFLIRLLAGWRRSRRLLRTALPLSESWTHGYDVRASRELTIPVTVGSTVLLPPDWPQWSSFTREAVLAHELSHVRRKDFYTHLLAGLHRAVFWFSPLSWWLQSHLLGLAEAASDDDAIGKVKDRASYAALLVDFASKGSKSGFVALSMARGKTVTMRVERMLDGVTASPGKSLLRNLLLVFGFVFVAGLSAGAWTVRAESMALPHPIVFTPQAAQQSPAPTATPVAQRQPAAAVQQQVTAPEVAERRSYLSNWIEQEVPDISTPEERDAFHRLRTDEEREQFIRSFWLRRDPTPETSENEFRNEYYRRIQLANQRFGTPGGVPGWLTDRGRILIRFGQPDELETHAIGGTFLNPGGGPPFERWRYRFLEGIGNNVILEFVDTARDGNYRLVEDFNVVKPEPAPQK